MLLAIRALTAAETGQLQEVSEAFDVLGKFSTFATMEEEDLDQA